MSIDDSNRIIKSIYRFNLKIETDIEAKYMTDVKEVKKVDKKRNVALIFCTVLTIIILVTSNAWSFIQTQRLHSQVDALRTENNSLKSQVSNLEMDKNSLQSQIDSLETIKSNLESQVSSLQSQINSLNFQINLLNSQVASLQKWLDGNKTLLKETQIKNEEYLKILRLQKVDWLDHDRVINIPPMSSSPMLMYLVPYTGVITISFSATGDVYFVIKVYYEGGIYYMDTGETPKIFPPVNITYRYPESGALSSGIFSFPAFTPWVTFAVVNPSTNQGVSVLITVKYTY